MNCSPSVPSATWSSNRVLLRSLSGLKPTVGGTCQRLALQASVAIWLVACSDGTENLEDVKAYIFAALTEKSQRNNTSLTVLDSNELRISYFIAEQAPGSLASALEQASATIVIPEIDVQGCVSSDEASMSQPVQCGEGVEVLVFVADGQKRFEAMANAVAAASPSRKSLVESTIGTAEQVASLGELTGEGPPVCTYLMVPDKNRKIVGGAVVILTLEGESAEICLLSSLYRIVGVEPYPQQQSVEKSLSYLSHREFGSNPMTALRFLYSSEHAADLSVLEKDIETWINAETAR